MKAAYAILIPYCRGDEWRERGLLAVVRHCWRHAGVPIVVSEQNSDSQRTIMQLREEGIDVDCVRRWSAGRFNKSSAWNVGIRHLYSKYGDVPVMFLDSDILLNADLLNPETVASRMASCRVWHPFDKIADLDRYESHVACTESLDGQRIQHFMDRARSGLRCYGGALVMRASDYALVGGYDQGFDAWGHEDDVFYYACRRWFPTGQCARERNAAIVHIWHPPQNSKEYLNGTKYYQLAQLRVDSVRRQKHDIRAYSSALRAGNALFALRASR
jgi:predicted glycosyltransferase involved in capsule biosynthesis